MRLRQLKEQHPGRVELTHKAFLLLAEDRQRNFTDYHLQHRQAARQMTGLPFDLPAVGTSYPRSSLPALEAAKWVGREHPEKFEAFDMALFEAFFQRTRDIGSVAVLADLAGQAGLPGGDLAGALQTGEFRQAVWADHRDALDLGITGIPTVLIGGYVFSGAVPFEDYDRAARRLLEGETRDSPGPYARPLTVR